MPAPQELTATLGAAIAGRASCRRFSGWPLTLEELATLLDAGYGEQGRTTTAGVDFALRPVPSAGARYPLELCLIVLAVTGLEPGTYRYLPSRHTLQQTGPIISPRAVSDLFLDQPYLAAASALAVVAATLRRSLERYGDRGYRYVLFEAGHVVQNLNLASSALQLASLNLGGFLDRALGDALHLAEQVPLYGVALGRPSTADTQAMRQSTG